MRSGNLLGFPPLPKRKAPEVTPAASGGNGGSKESNGEEGKKTGRQRSTITLTSGRKAAEGLEDGAAAMSAESPKGKGDRGRSGNKGRLTSEDDVDDGEEDGDVRKTPSGDKGGALRDINTLGGRNNSVKRSSTGVPENMSQEVKG